MSEHAPLITASGSELTPPASSAAPRPGGRRLAAVALGLSIGLAPVALAGCAGDPPPPVATCADLYDAARAAARQDDAANDKIAAKRAAKQKAQNEGHPLSPHVGTDVETDGLNTATYARVLRGDILQYTDPSGIKCSPGLPTVEAVGRRKSFTECNVLVVRIIRQHDAFGSKENTFTEIDWNDSPNGISWTQGVLKRTYAESGLPEPEIIVHDFLGQIAKAPITVADEDALCGRTGVVR